MTTDSLFAASLFGLETGVASHQSVDARGE
jgi:hypothetical protein